MSALPVSEVAPRIPTVDEAKHALAVALTDEDGYWIEPPCGQAPDEWFPDQGEPSRDARRHCLRFCPAFMECRIYAMVAGERHGVWGGVSAKSMYRGTEEERRARLLTWISEA